MSPSLSTSGSWAVLRKARGSLCLRPPSRAVSNEGPGSALKRGGLGQGELLGLVEDSFSPDILLRSAQGSALPRNLVPEPQGLAWALGPSVCKCFSCCIHPIHIHASRSSLCRQMQADCRQAARSLRTLPSVLHWRLTPRKMPTCQVCDSILNLYSYM